MAAARSVLARQAEPPLEAFGRGLPVLGERPLLVVLVETEITFAPGEVERLRQLL